MTPGEALREAADTVDRYVVSERQAQIIELMCLHIRRLDCSPNAVREAALLCRLLAD